MVFVIRITVTQDCGIRGLRLFTHVPLYTIFGSNNPFQRNAEWQCEATAASSACETTIGDLAAGAVMELEFPVQVNSDVPLGTKIQMEVTGTDADGNTHNAINDLNYDEAVQPYEILLPLVNNSPF